MSYKLNKTDGSLLVDLVDGQLDTSSSDLTLIGRNYSGFGEVLNENFIQLLENFANTSAPINPIRGQLWYDTSENRLKVYNGTAFTSSGGTTVAEQQPNMVAGDLWIDSTKSQLYFFDGVRLQLVGPAYSTAQGTSGFQVNSIIDTQNITQTVVKMFVGGNLVGVHANATFTPIASARIQELVTVSNPLGTLQKGFNTVGTDYKYVGTATIAQSLVDGNGVVRTADQYLVSDNDDTTVGALTIQNNAGLTIGLNNNTKLQFTDNAFTIANQLSSQDVEIKVRTPAEVIAFKIDADKPTDEWINPQTQQPEYRNIGAVGIYEANPSATLHVGGDVKIDGRLTVNSDITYVDTANLRVKDKNIELNIDEDGNTTPNAGADGGGIILKSTQGDKTFTWSGTGAWTSSENIDLEAGKGYKINTKTVLTETTLGGTVTGSSLTSLGKLEKLAVTDISIDGSTITTFPPDPTDPSYVPVDLKLDSGTNLIQVLNSTRITGVGSPINASDVATKEYTDGSTIISLQLDVSNFTQNAAGNNYLNTREVLERLYPVAGYNSGSSEPPILVPGAVIPARNQGALARVLTVDYGAGGGFTIPILDFSGLKNFETVDKSYPTQQRTIASVTFSAQDPSLPADHVKITLTTPHFYEGGQQVVIGNAPITNGGPGALPDINNTYTIAAAEFQSESPNFVSFTVPFADGSNSTKYGSATVTTGNVTRTSIVGNSNKQVVEDISNASNVTGTITFAPTRKLLQFVVNNGAWAFDREITLGLTP